MTVNSVIDICFVFYHIRNVYGFMSLQLIFRKVADVKREKELAEKRKNDPPLELASDHPVRKLISRFRKISDHKITVNKDAEKGDIANNVGNSIDHHKGLTGNSTTKLVNISEKDKPAGGLLNAASGGTKASKWGKFLAGAASVTAANNVAPTNAPLANNAKQEQAAAAPKPKPLSKWGRLLAPTTQEPIQEKPAEEAREQGEAHQKPTNLKDAKSNLKKSESTDSGILKSDMKLDQIDPASGEKGAEGPVTQRDVVFSVGGGSNLSVTNEQQLISSLQDIKIEIKEEIVTLNQKMNKIDEQISEILRMFSPSSSPSSSHSSSLGSSRVTSSNGSSNSSTASNSIVTSPKSSLPSSPYMAPLESLPVTSIDSNTSRVSSPPSRKDSADSNGSQGIGTSKSGSQDSTASSKRSSPKHSDASNGNSSVSSRSRSAKKRKSSAGSRIRVAPLYTGEESQQGLQPPQHQPQQQQQQQQQGQAAKQPQGTVSPAKDDDNVPIKDRDLDIL